MMFERVFYRFNRRVVLVVACLILLGASFVLYIQSQQPVEEERLSGSTWCLIPFSPFLKWTFNEDSSFVRKIIIPDEYDATVITDTGTWSVYEKETESWIRVVYDDTQLEELFPIKASVGNYLRIGGKFKGLGNTVNLYRCARQ